MAFVFLNRYLDLVEVSVFFISRNIYLKKSILSAVLKLYSGYLHIFFQSVFSFGNCIV